MTAAPPFGEEWVVLLDVQGRPIGSAPKAEVHHGNTPLHLAFSCWVVDERGRTLLTQRSAAKRTWPGAWTNSFCGHPAPGERIEDAVHRRARDELGTTVTEPVTVLPDFRYRAVMDDGTVENEICPVHVARLLYRPDPNPAEVGDLRWVSYAELPAAVADDSSSYSPWMREQLDALLAVGWTPSAG
ncbi:MAG: isopentenyl-diphosphate Delta-isomerase [Actinomycetota bacterium]|nr:isopentenyl-diphosphate Delta-isomerase [Actinomycetota bacterium]